MQFIQANKRSEGLKMFWTRKKKTRPTEDANDVRNALADSQLKWSNWNLMPATIRAFTSTPYFYSYLLQFSGEDKDFELL